MLAAQSRAGLHWGLKTREAVTGTGLIAAKKGLGPGDWHFKSYLIEGKVPVTWGVGRFCLALADVIYWRHNHLNCRLGSICTVNWDDDSSVSERDIHDGKTRTFT
jgi:hypothetical protein